MIAVTHTVCPLPDYHFYIKSGGGLPQLQGTIRWCNLSYLSDEKAGARTEKANYSTCSTGDEQAAIQVKDGATRSSLRTLRYTDFGTSDGFSVHLKLGRNVASFINSKQENRRPLWRLGGWVRSGLACRESSMTLDPRTGGELKLSVFAAGRVLVHELATVLHVCCYNKLDAQHFLKSEYYYWNKRKVSVWWPWPDRQTAKQIILSSQRLKGKSFKNHHTDKELGSGSRSYNSDAWACWCLVSRWPSTSPAAH